MVFLSLALVLAAADPSPGAAVVISRRTNVTVAEVQAVAREVTEVLRRAGVPALEAQAAVTQLAKLGVSDPAACAGKKACVAELGAQLGVEWVMAVSVSQIDNERSVAVELLRVKDQAIVERDALILTGKAKITRELLARFADRSRAAMGLAVPSRPDTPVVEAPVVPPKVDLVAPSPAPVHPSPLQPGPPEKGHSVSLALGGVGIAAVAAGAVLLGMGLGTRAGLSAGAPGPDGLVRSPLTGSAAQLRNGQANLELAGAGAAAAVGLALGTAAVLAW